MGLASKGFAPAWEGGGEELPIFLYFVWYRRAAEISPFFHAIYTTVGRDLIDGWIGRSEFSNICSKTSNPTSGVAQKNLNAKNARVQFWTVALLTPSICGRV